MKVKLFTHACDIDGLGCVVLAKLAFGQVDFTLCDYGNIDDKVENDYISCRLYDYDKIFLTDISVKYKTANLLAIDDHLQDNLLILDHHPSAINDQLHHFPFTRIIVEENGRPTCGTELFYKHLVENNYLKATPALNEFVELTRRHDTWEWKTKYNDEKSHMLAQFLTATWKSNYIDVMTQKLREDSRHFDFSKEDKDVILKYQLDWQNRLEKCIDNMKFVNVRGTRFGIAEIKHELRNEITSYCRDLNVDADAIAIPNYNQGTCSLRALVRSCDVQKIAEEYGGSGHPGASSCHMNKKFLRDFKILKENTETLEQ